MTIIYLNFAADFDNVYVVWEEKRESPIVLRVSTVDGIISVDGTDILRFANDNLFKFSIIIRQLFLTFHERNQITSEHVYS